MNRFLWPLAIVIGLLVFLVMGLRHGDPRALPSPFIGKPAPRFEICARTPFAGLTSSAIRTLHRPTMRMVVSGSTGVCMARPKPFSSIRRAPWSTSTSARWMRQSGSENSWRV